ncbi:MAG: bifunctional tetrahydrofolate synthase/dihydrofolate synthase [Porticoccaceae bacterium]|nr:bifunctional tetrahydrofolate synthase/dihydrofolate synthase [Pseudomonadales bacterium]MCP5171734.1 bifunctional tetrahydrofolate synthase/dihydrofolate synthase [Pseudomonadales bacterium]
MTKKRSLAEWLTLLERRHPSEIDLGLERIAQVADRLQLNSPAAKVITIAGTNGKGSCVTVLERLLCDAGIAVGAYSSPHLLHYNERIRINGSDSSDESICRAFEQIERARGDTSLTYFEFGTLAALLIMRDARVDVAILEVGLGGRLDAVNIVDADVAIVTSIALDHQDWLGSDLNVIAGEKAAIARAEKPLIYGGDQMLPAITDTAKNTGARLLHLKQDFYFDLPTPLVLPEASVQCALQALSFVAPEVSKSLDLLRLKDITLRGRFQKVLVDDVMVILDVAHNPAAASRLAFKLKEIEAKGHLRAVAGIMADKDMAGIVAPLNELVDDWFPVEIPGQSRAADRKEWQGILCNTRVHESVEAGFETALSRSEAGDTLLVFGSFFTVAPVLKLLDQKGVVV